jgi:SAM-dependent methyltransferase
MDDFQALNDNVSLARRTVVDVGCGDGSNVRKLRGAGADAIGVDIDIAAATRRDPDGRYLQGGAERLPLDDQSVDIAVLFKSLHHVPDPHAAFPELHRVVRDLVFIAEPLPEGEFFELLKPVDDETHVRAVAQEAIQRAKGFERTRTFEYEITFEMTDFQQLKDRVLAADPTRAQRFAQLEPQLREAFTPGPYTIPVRAALLARA